MQRYFSLALYVEGWSSHGKNVSKNNVHLLRRTRLVINSFLLRTRKQK